MLMTLLLSPNNRFIDWFGSCVYEPGEYTETKFEEKEDIILRGLKKSHADLDKQKKRMKHLLNLFQQQQNMTAKIAEKVSTG